ncbi:protease modulator HflC [Treponema phagedenis]|uniref:Protein HflC n=2 Tax=Treponema phagedenis TaxID=162 RepID=A0A0B7GX23_TREPH|nr:protease modulator HflC [Treponema phagedenis]QSH98778.1 protease modulator HflC [Treponema phagedenis]TYT78582.1 protease modulator HflC [Treponema phagedenis]CEM63058.1 Protein HflC [Treponema phagedenis]
MGKIKINEMDPKAQEKIKKVVKTILILVAVFLVFIFAKPFYILQEGETSIVTQFGEIVKTETSAGLHFKTPFIHTIHKYTSKLLRIDGDPQKILTKEKQFIEVDTTSRWKIADIKKFYQSLVTYEVAYSRVSDIIDSSVRDIITINSLDDVVRNSNVINETNHKEQFDIDSNEVNLDELPTEKILYPTIHKGRDVLAKEILQRANAELNDFGIEVVDVIFKGIKYSDELQTSVFNRMIKDRNQIAQMFRSMGEGKKAEWLGKLDNEKRSILSKAYKESEILKGEADAKATAIYAQAYGKSPEFYSFWKSLEVYKKNLVNTEKILSTDMEYFQYLYKH